MTKMTQFVRLAAHKTKDRRRGHTQHLTAKLVCNSIVFAGSQAGQRSISADADITLINARWIEYCAANDTGSLSGLEVIERGMLDAARGK